MHPFAFRFKRKFVRYRIQDPELFKGSIGPLRPSFQLVTFGRGGAGFWSSVEAKELSPPARIHCHFYSPEMDPAYLSIEADLLYSLCQSQGGLEKVYYGVEFVDKSDPQILALLNLVKRLHKSGAVILDPH
ncbi:MAG: PilZ domain-containing protein [Bradymonadales bacterium]|nr:MAG: PilZ domain-containing protein [Bradymonadales bacterium]